MYQEAAGRLLQIDLYVSGGSWTLPPNNISMYQEAAGRFLQIDLYVSGGSWTLSPNISVCIRRQLDASSK